MFRRVVETRNDFAIAILRLALGVASFAHGAQKMLGWWGGRGFSGTMDFYTHLGFSTPVVVLGILVEFLGGLALLTGFLGRIAALGILGKLAATIWHITGQNGFFMNWTGNKVGEGFEYHMLAFAMGLAILLSGSGAISVDRSLSKPGAAQS